MVFWLVASAAVLLLILAGARIAALARQVTQLRTDVNQLSVAASWLYVELGYETTPTPTTGRHRPRQEPSQP